MILSTTKPVDGSSNLRVGLVTTHIPIKNVSKNVTQNLLANKTISFEKTLRKIWKISLPKLNLFVQPHAGESGLVGREEMDIIIPTIENLKKKLIYQDH